MKSDEAISWLFLGLRGSLRIRRANTAHLRGLWAACFYPLHPPVLPLTGDSLRHVSSGLENEAHRLFKPLHWQASLGHCTTMPSSLRERGQLCQDRAECWTHWAPLTNQTVPGSQTALITAVCRNEKDRMNQSDLSGNHSMLFKVNVFVIYKKFPAWSFVWEKKNLIVLLPSS